MSATTTRLVSSVFVVVALIVLGEISSATADLEHSAVRRPLKADRIRHQRVKLRRHGNVASSVVGSSTDADDWTRTVKSTRRRADRALQRAAAAAALVDQDVDGHAPRCVNIPDNLDTCRSLLGYRQMRTPDLVRTAFNNGILSSVGRDVIGDWIKDALNPAGSGRVTDGRSVAGFSTCSPAAGLLVCSLVSPVCLEMPVWPCRSLCERVRRDCSAAGGGGGHGARWPEAVDCNWLPNDDQLCIGRNETDDVGESTVNAVPSGVRTPTVMTSSQTKTATSGGNIRVGDDVIEAFPSNAISKPRNALQLLQAANNVSDTSASSLPVCVHPDCVQPEAASDTLLDNFCAAEFVAKIRPDRYVTSGSDVKIVASKSIKFYKFPLTMSTPSGQRSKWIFHIGRPSITNCSCNNHQLTDPDGDRSTVGAENLVVMGRLLRGRRGEHHQKPRLEVSAIAVFDSRSKDFRRALRAIKNVDACARGRAPVAPDTVSLTTVTEPRTWSNVDRGTSRKSDKKRQRVALSETDVISGGVGGRGRGGGASRKLIAMNKKFRKRAEKIRARKEGIRKDEAARLNIDYETERAIGDNRHRRRPLNQLSGLPRRHQSRPKQEQADEETIMANRRDRIERRKFSGPVGHQRNASRRNNRNDDNFRRTEAEAV